MSKEKCVNKKLHPYWKTGIYGWLGEEVDDNDYMFCPLCGEMLATNYWNYSAENDGDNKCPKCGQELDYSEIYDFEDTLYFRQLLEIKDEQIEMLKKENKRLSKNLKLSRVQKENFYNNLLEKDLEKLKINLHEILFNKYGCDEKAPVFNLKIIIDDVIDYSKPCFKRRK